MTDLAAYKDQSHYLIVITDRLSKEIILEAMCTMTAEACATRFINCFYRFHGFPRAISSDRGSNWVCEFWRRVCKRVGIEQRLSTAFYPQSDGATENLLSAAQLALNKRDSSLGYSPFFLNYGYHVLTIALFTDTKDSVTTLTKAASSNARKADNFARKLEEGQALAQASMAWRQQIMEDAGNQGRQQSEVFKLGDCVWLNLKNIATPRPSRKPSWLHAKYEVVKITSPHVIQLDVPIGVHPRFHVDMLKRAADDLLPSQIQKD
ncbi:hypothetical protein K3495_g5321 [Podosphaera aphanis]|nr:hypothetical protein K3495_g5321 [Podosphaera aphanis]